MTNEEVRSKNSELVNAIKVEVERVQRIRNVAPQMLRLLKDMLEKSDERVALWLPYINKVVRAAEGNSN